MFVDDLREKIKGKGVRIVFTEGPDNRVQEAAVPCLEVNTMKFRG